MAKLEAKPFTESTGILNVYHPSTADDEPIYDLQGRRVESNNLKTGIYIVGGRKVVMTK
jgi:hypothetical protein